jgi:hypothetical protein
MAELSVRLPEPHPEDAEDVVWGLSTATALWHRGERGDAVVWLRRAAESAGSSGQTFRSTELGMYAQELEDALAAAEIVTGSLAPPPPPVEESAAAAFGAALPPPPPPPRAPLHSIEVDLDLDLDLDADGVSPAPSPAASSDLGSLRPPPPPLMRPPTVVPPAPTPLPSSVATTRGPGSMPPPPPLVPAAPPSRGSAVPPPRSVPPPAGASAPSPLPDFSTPLPAPPLTPTLNVEEERSATPQDSSIPPLVDPLTTAAFVTTPAPGTTRPMSVPPPAGSRRGGSGGPGRSKPSAREPAPMLDPWADSGENSAQQREEAASRRKTGTNEASARSRVASLLEDEDVITSAAPIEQTLGRKPPAPPPPAPPTLSGTQLALQQPVSTRVTGAPPPPPPAAAARPAGAPSPVPPAVPPAPPAAVATPDDTTEPPAPQPALAAPPEAAAASATVSPSVLTPAQPGQLAVVAAVPPKRPSIPAPRPSTLPPARISVTPAPPTAAKVELAAPKPDTVAPPAPKPEMQTMNPAARRAPDDTLPSNMLSPLAQEAAKANLPLSALPAPPAPRSEAPTVSEFLKRSTPSVPPPAVNKAAPSGRSALSAMTADTLQPVAPEDMPPAPAGASADAAKKPAYTTSSAPTVPRPLAPRLSTPAPPAPPAPVPVAKAPTAPPPSPIKASTVPPPLAAEPTRPSELPRIGDIALETIDAFADLPEDVQRTLVQAAVVEDLAAGAARTGFGAVLVLAGEVSICAIDVSAPAQRMRQRAFVPAKGTLAAGLPMRVVGGAGGAKVAVWTPEILDAALRSCSWVLDDCGALADRLQARAGLTIGPLGQADAETRDGIAERLVMRVLAPGEVITEEQGPMPGIAFVVAGTIETLDGDPPAVVSELRPGELLFPEATWAGAPAPMTSRAAQGGAILLIGDRKIALELVANVPVVADILAR